MECSCISVTKSVLLCSCSGAANTGNLADQVALRLSAGGAGKMTCLAAVGARMSRELSYVR
jgi:uncharacterized metal-binding protein